MFGLPARRPCSLPLLWYRYASWKGKRLRGLLLEGYLPEATAAR